MRSVPSFLHDAGDSVGSHLDRLRDTLDELRQRLRDAVVHAVGQSLAGVVRDSLRAFFEGLAASRREAAPPWHSERWRQPDDPLYADELAADDRRYAAEDDGWYDNDTYEDEPRQPSEAAPPEEEPRQSRWRQALAIGCSAAAWHLRRQVTGSAR
jgi:hypothetical protein